MIVRLVTILAAAALLAGCSTEEGLRAQQLLQQAEAAQQQLRSSTFDGSMAVSLDGMNVQMLFEGATSAEGQWFALRTVGAPGGADVAMEMVVRGGRAWTNFGGSWQSTPVPAGGSSGALNGAAFQELARYVKDVRVTEHRLVEGKAVTTIAGEIDTQAMLEAIMELGSLAPSGSFDLGDLGVDIGDIRAVLTIDERTHLLDTAFIAFELSAQGKTMAIELRYRLASVNGPVTLPAP